MAKALPAIFFGHGNPMNAISRNRYTDAWQRIGQQTTKPKAVLSISAHWYVPETAVTAAAAPETIHDFGGFPTELYKVQYPAPGDPAMAQPEAYLDGTDKLFDGNGKLINDGTREVLKRFVEAYAAWVTANTMS